MGGPSVPRCGISPGCNPLVILQSVHLRVVWRSCCSMGAPSTAEDNRKSRKSLQRRIAPCGTAFAIGEGGHQQDVMMRSTAQTNNGPALALLVLVLLTFFLGGM